MSRESALIGLEMGMYKGKHRPCHQMPKSEIESQQYSFNAA
jgi:hypothetical protein